MSIYMCDNGPCTAEVKNSYKPCANLIESWAGCVLWTGEHNWYGDSDFYAVVWDEAAGQTRDIEYASTRGWTYHNYAVVDADEQTMAKAKAYQAECDRGLRALIRQQEAADVKIGKEVRSTTRRGKNVGVVGTVRRMAPSHYHSGDVAALEVIGEDRFRWIDVRSLEVINPDQYL